VEKGSSVGGGGFGVGGGGFGFFVLGREESQNLSLGPTGAGRVNLQKEDIGEQRGPGNRGLPSPDRRMGSWSRQKNSPEQQERQRGGEGDQLSSVA